MNDIWINRGRGYTHINIGAARISQIGSTPPGWVTLRVDGGHTVELPVAQVVAVLRSLTQPQDSKP